MTQLTKLNNFTVTGICWKSLFTNSVSDDTLHHFFTFFLSLKSRILCKAQEVGFYFIFPRNNNNNNHKNPFLFFIVYFLICISNLNCSDKLFHLDLTINVALDIGMNNLLPGCGGWTYNTLVSSSRLYYIHNNFLYINV